MATSPAVLNISNGASYASPPRRIAAYLLDILLAAFVMLPTAISMRILRAIGLWSSNPAVADPSAMWMNMGLAPKLMVFLAYVIAMGPLYFIIFHASPWQATLGKRLFKIYVTDDSGQRIPLAKSFNRWFSLAFSWCFGLWLVSLITVAISKNKKALHDMSAGTLVLDGTAGTSASLEPWRIFVAFGVPFVWLIATFMIIM